MIDCDSSSIDKIGDEFDDNFESLLSLGRGGSPMGCLLACEEGAAPPNATTNINKFDIFKIDNNAEKKEDKTVLQCEFCPKTFVRPAQYHGHMRVHYKNKTIKCDKCEDASFSSKQDLLEHQAAAHNLPLKRFSCPVPQCQQSFLIASHLDYHQRSVHAKERNLQCLSCGVRFFKKSDLKSHLVIHDVSKRLPCSVCQRKFSHVSNLNRHMQLHTQTKPYSCSQCPASFTQAISLKNHKKKHAAPADDSESLSPKLLQGAHMFSEETNNPPQPELRVENPKNALKDEPKGNLNLINDMTVSNLNDFMEDQARSAAVEDMFTKMEPSEDSLNSMLIQNFEYNMEKNHNPLNKNDLNRNELNEAEEIIDALAGAMGQNIVLNEIIQESSKILATPKKDNSFSEAILENEHDNISLNAIETFTDMRTFSDISDYSNQSYSMVNFELLTRLSETHNDNLEIFNMQELNKCTFDDVSDISIDKMTLDNAETLDGDCFLKDSYFDSELVKILESSKIENEQTVQNSVAESEKVLNEPAFDFLNPVVSKKSPKKKRKNNVASKNQASKSVCEISNNILNIKSIAPLENEMNVISVDHSLQNEQVTKSAIEDQTEDLIRLVEQDQLQLYATEDRDTFIISLNSAMDADTLEHLLHEGVLTIQVDDQDKQNNAEVPETNEQHSKIEFENYKKKKEQAECSTVVTDDKTTTKNVLNEKKHGIKNQIDKSKIIKCIEPISSVQDCEVIIMKHSSEILDFSLAKDNKQKKEKIPFLNMEQNLSSPVCQGDKEVRLEQSREENSSNIGESNFNNLVLMSSDVLKNSKITGDEKTVTIFVNDFEDVVVQYAPGKRKKLKNSKSDSIEPKREINAESKKERSDLKNAMEELACDEKSGEKELSDDVGGDHKPSLRIKRKPKNVLRKCRIFKCKVCFQIFNKKDSYKSHIGSHDSRLKRHWCEECGEQFSWRSTLTRHISAKHRPRVCCALCEAHYTTKGQLQLHMRRAHQKERNHCCTFPNCGQAFFKKYYLSAHYRTHTMERPFCCDLCGSTFKNLSNIRRHRLTHFTPVPPHGPKLMRCQKIT